MRVRVYLREWMINAGIVGFLRILQRAEDEFAELKKDYIEFDTENLRNFSQYYFSYFFQTYNIAEKTKKRIKSPFHNLEEKMKVEAKDRAEEKKKKDDIKKEKKYIKQTVNYEAKKIEKIDKEVYEQIITLLNRLDEIEKEEEIAKLSKIEKDLGEIFERKEINERLTMNFFKSILSKNYFGQPSFLNVVKTALSFEEQQEVMQKDYVSNIIETGYLEDIVNNRYTMEEIKEVITEKLEDKGITEEVRKIYANLDKKIIQKNKTLSEMQQYIQEEFFSCCCFCGREHGLTSNYSESNFIPLAVSNENMQNFFWNQNAKLPICDICKLMLFCTPAGITSITKTVQENGTYKEKEVYSFINYDTSVNMLRKVNEDFAAKSARDKGVENPYATVIMDIVEQEEQMSDWQLQNIFVVEFETEYLAYSRMEYFNIKRYVAQFFKIYAKKSLGEIKDYRFKLQLIDSILKDKDLKYAISDKIKNNLSEQTSYGYNTFLAARVRMLLNLLKKGDGKMSKTKEQIEKQDKDLYSLYNIGVYIHETLKSANAENKLDGYIYKMLNSIKAGNKAEFMDTVIRLHLSLGKNVSPIFIQTMESEKLDFESVGHSFLSGLISGRYEKGEGNNKEVSGNV